MMNDEIPAMLVKTIPGITNNWEKYGSYFKKEEIRAKKIILNEGEIAKRIYFIESGCIRMFFTDANKDVSVQFFFEDTLICSMESFLKHLPSKFSLETLETGTYYGDSDEPDHLIPAQADHQFRGKLTRGFRDKLTTLNV